MATERPAHDDIEGTAAPREVLPDLPSSIRPLGFRFAYFAEVNPSGNHKPILGPFYNLYNPCVIKVREKYFALADATNYPESLGGDGRLLTMAESMNGIGWSYLGYLRPEGMASSHVPQALLSTIDGVEWLYVPYAWKPETVKEDVWDFRYKEIRTMRIRASDL